MLRALVDIMKIFIISIFAVIIPCIKGSYRTLDIQSDVYSEVPKLVRRYCDLPVENRKIFRFCLQENGIGIGPELYRNCAQQVNFCHTFEELDKFVCQPGTKLDSLFLKCFIPAYSAFHLYNPKVIPVTQKCLSNEENSGFHAKDHIKEVYEF